MAWRWGGGRSSARRHPEERLHGGQTRADKQKGSAARKALITATAIRVMRPDGRTAGGGGQWVGWLSSQMRADNTHASPSPSHVLFSCRCTPRGVLMKQQCLLISNPSPTPPILPLSSSPSFHATVPPPLTTWGRHLHARVLAACCQLVSFKHVF